MDLRDHFHVIWRRRWVVLALSVLIAGAVYGVSSLQAKVYQAQAEVSVTPGTSANGQGLAQTDTLFVTSTYAQLAVTRPVVQDALRRSHLHIDVGTATKRLTVTASNDIGFLSVAAAGPSPSAATALAASEVKALLATVASQQAQALASQLAGVQASIAGVTRQLHAAPSGSAAQALLTTQLQSLYQAVANRQSQPADQLTVVAPARADPTPLSPKPKRNALLGFVTALVLDSELVVLYEAVSDRFPAEKLDEEVARISGLPVLAHVPVGDAAVVVESFRSLRTNLLFMDTAQKMRAVAVVSAEPGAGKSFTSINLAISVAELGVSVALVDADLRRPALAERLGLPVSPGLSDVLRGAKLLSSCLRPVEGIPELRVLPAGEELGDPAGLMARSLATRVLRGFDHEDVPSAELVVIDTPAEALFPDAVTVAVHCDGVIVVVDARKGRRRALLHTLERLTQVNATPLGIVVNRANVEGNASYYSYRSPRPPSPSPAAT